MKYLIKIHRLGLRYPFWVLGLSLILTTLAFLGAARLKIENNLSALLPKNFESVQALKNMEESFGGLGFLVVAVEGPTAKSTQRFAAALVQEIEGLDAVAYVDYKRPVGFFQDRAWLFLDLDDLQEMEARLDRSLELQKKGVSPYFNHLMDFADPEDRPDLTYEDIRQRYEDRYGFEFRAETAEHPSSDEGKFVAFKVKTKTHQQNLDANQVVLAQISEITKTLQKDPTFSQVQVSFSGDHVQALETVEYLRSRMTWVSVLVFALLIFVLWAYLRRFSAVFFVGLPLICGILWTGGLIWLFLGHLNIITGFAAGILAGLGSDYGIYIVTRFFQEKGAGRSFQEACERAFENTGQASYSSMLTTVFAFLALLFTEFGVTVEFGIVGALGLFMNFLAMMVVLSSLIALREKYLVRKSKLNVGDRQVGNLHGALEKSPFFQKVFYPRLPVLGVFLFLLIGLAATFTLPHQSQLQFNDGRLDSLGTPGEKLYGKVSQLYGGTLQPTMLLVPSPAEGREVVRAFREVLDRAADHTALPFKNVLGLSNFVPQRQSEKQTILARLSEKFKESNFPVENKRLEMIESFETSAQAQPITRSKLPEEVTRLFQSPKKDNVMAVFLFPNFTDLTWEWMNDYAETVYQVRRDYDLNFQAVDNPFVATEFVKMMDKLAPRMLGLTLLFMAVILFWVVRPWLRALMILGHLVLGLVLLSGAMWILGLDLNTINFAAFPIILGTGIDSFIHFGLRYDETGDMKETINNKLPTILISNLTTVIGFTGLLFIPSEGLRSLGWVALMGLIIMTALCALSFPRGLLLLADREERRIQLKTIEKGA